MKIGIYHEYFPRIGGVETFTLTLAKFLSKTHEVTLLYKRSQDDSIFLNYLEYFNIVNIEYDQSNFIFDYLVIASNHIKPKQLNAKKIYQVVHSDYRKYNINKIYNQEVVDEYISVSQVARESVEELYKVKSSVIHNFIDAEYFSDLKPPKYTFLTIARISLEKGFDRMLKVCDMLEGVNYQWFVVGENTQDKVYEQGIINKFKRFDRVHFVGGKKDVRYFYSIADILFLLSDFEGSPYVIHEALYMGIPVVTTDYPSSKEIVENGKTGYIVKSDLSNLNIKVIDEVINYKNKDFSIINKEKELLWLKKFA